MFTLSKGDCEHCSRTFHYQLWQAGFGDFSYAYCDSCGTLAVFNFSNQKLNALPALSETHRAIDAAWEPHLAPCGCGGRFRKGAAPRCVHCNSILSPEYAASYIERNSTERLRGWHWQNNWNADYCLAIEDPHEPGTLRQVTDPILEAVPAPGKKPGNVHLGRDG
ncbi:MAG TPA: hypothetical protein VMV57_07415 [Terracidiphilus sp.]|nr:hypothetical protein [Terracidiphilus sp.]